MQQHALTIRSKAIPSDIWTDLKRMQARGAVLDVRRYHTEYRVLLSIPDGVRIPLEQITCLAGFCAAVK